MILYLPVVVCLSLPFSTRESCGIVIYVYLTYKNLINSSLVVYFFLIFMLLIVSVFLAIAIFITPSTDLVFASQDRISALLWM